MAIIVEIKSNKSKFFLLGTGLGMYKSSLPGVFGGSLMPNVEEGRIESVAVCDKNGEIFFMDRSSLRVVEIDGMDLEEINLKLNS